MKRDRYGNQQQQQHYHHHHHEEIPPPPPPKPQQQQRQQEETPPPPPPRTQLRQEQLQQEEIPPPPPPRIKPLHQDIPPPPPPRARPSLSSARSDGVVAAASGSSNPPPAVYLPTTAVTWTASGMNGDGGAGDGAANVFSSSVISLPSSTLTSAAPKRAKRETAEVDGWRAKADDILVKAGREDSKRDSKGPGGEDVPSRGGRGADVNGKQGKTAGGMATRPRSKRRFAVVCSANFNRSMMAHKLLKEHNFQVESYGTGREVRLPGKDVSSPEVFPFGTPYRDIYDTLKGKDEKFFLHNNLLPLVARNATIKAAPERFQEIEGPDMAGFDVVLCFESRVFYLVVEDLQSRDPETFKPLHVVNMSIKDSFEESAAAADSVLELCRTLDGLFRLEDEAADVLEAFTRKTRRTVLHQVCHV